MISDTIGRGITSLTEDVRCPDDLASVMTVLSRELGFEYFALSHHVDLSGPSEGFVRLHNYPAAWADFYDENGLGVSDPVHRASHVTSVGFLWSRIPDMIPLTAHDLQTLRLGHAQGIGDGFTVPANVPGEARGSCSFASPDGRRPPDAALRSAQLVGAFAFETARRLTLGRGHLTADRAPSITDRQRDCVLWAARGKSDWEISRILEISEETVASHIKQALGRYGVGKRTSLIIRLLFDGTISFGDVLRRRHPPFPG